MKIQELSFERKRNLVGEIVAKKNGDLDQDWSELVQNYGLDCNPDTLRKAGVGVQLACDVFADSGTENQDYVERQKLFDLRRDIKKSLRELSRTELICESICNAIKTLPEIKIERCHTSSFDAKKAQRELVVGVGDFHYGAEYTVYGLYGEEINRYNSCIFEIRMAKLLDSISDILKKENPEQITIMIVGDVQEGLIRQSQLQRLEYGVIESTMRLSEFLAQWLAQLEEISQIPIRVYAVRGNHGEIRPLGSKAGQFPEENMERIVMHYLRARFEEHGCIWVASDAPMKQMIDVCGYQFMLAHGQNINIESMARDSVNLYNTKIDAFVVGHLHKNQTFQSGIINGANVYVERIPSICGVDPYAQNLGYGGQPGATAIIIEKGYGRRCVYPIQL